MSIATWIRRVRGTADLRERIGDTMTPIALDDSGMLKYGAGGTTREVVDVAQTQTITGDKTLSGTTTLSGAVAFTGGTSKTGIVQQHADHAKVGAGAGWVVNAADNKNSLGRVPAGVTAGTLVVPLSVRVGDIITGYYLVGQIEAGGNTCTVDAALRKQTAAAADLTDGAVTNGSITQVSVIADTILSATNAGVTGLTTTVAADETYYVLVTVTTGASTDVDLQTVNMTKTAV